MPRIYLTGSSLGRGYITGSGVISNPARTILALRDNATSSYPSVSRIGDPGRTGRYSINFNDTNSVVFNSNVTTSYPSDLQLADAAYINQSIATPNTNATIEATGIVRKGVADANITFTPGEDLTPFVEDNLFASTPEAFTDPFYLTGSTVADVGLGFTAPLRSKTKIEIDLSTNTGIQFGRLFGPTLVSSHPADYMNRRNRPMIYYNHVSKKWEPIGLGAIDWNDQGNYPSTYNYSNGVRLMWENDCTWGFAPSVGYNRIKGMTVTESLLRAAGNPIDSFGFPHHPKFHATASQALSLSGFIDRPFLAEKFVVEWSGSFHSRATSLEDFQLANRNSVGGYVSIDDNLGAIASFFILNQRSNSPLSASVQNNYYAQGDINDTSSIYLTSSIPTDIPLTWDSTAQDNGPVTHVDTMRYIATWGRHTILSMSNSELEAIGTNSGSIRRALQSELLTEIDLPGGGNVWGDDFHIMSGNFKVPARSGPISSISNVSPDYTSALPAGYVQYLENSVGGRSGVEMLQSGRDLVNPFAGVIPSGSSFFYAQTPADAQANFQGTIQNSPYLFLPEDDIIVGWQSPAWGRPGENGADQSGDAYTGYEIYPSKAKLTIYGSLITDAHEHHDGLNQPLTSDAVHEFIGFHGPPLDQFDTEPRQQFSGSMLSSVITGSITTTEQPIVEYYSILPTLRGVAGQRATGEWTGGQFTHLGGTTASTFAISNANGVVRKPGSFDRSLLLSSENEVFYDSFPPDVFQVYQKLAIDPTYVNGGVWNIFVGSTPIVPDPGTPNWRGFFPFEPLVSDVPRAVTGDLSSNSGLDYQSVKSYLGSTLGTVRDIYANIESGVWLYDVEKGQAADNIKIFLYGTGDYKSALNGTLNGGPSMWGAFGGFPTAFVYGYVRGFKYGLYHANKRSTYCKFRSDKYGQFRDMLEQRMDTRFYSETSGRSTVSASPVQVRFVASDGTSESPSKTSSSNLSQFATSSLPYFDGVARNRGPIETADLGLTIVSI